LLKNFEIYIKKDIFLKKEVTILGKSEGNKKLNLTYDDQGTNMVSEQIMDAYNSGVIDQEDGQFVWKDLKTD
jgi:hypothetical protein